MPNLNARGLKQQRSRLIGMTVKDVKNPFYMNVVTRVEQRLLARDYRAFISFTDQQTHDETRCLETMRASRVDGVVFSPENARCEHLVKAMCAQGVRFLQLYKKVFPDIDSLCNDNEMGTFLGTQHLLDMGHQRIVFIRHTESDGRAAGFRRAYADRGLTVSPGQIIGECADDAEMTGRVRAAFDSVKPTALFAATSRPSMIVFRLLWDMGIRIPEEMSLLVYDDQPWCEMLGISVITHPFDAIAETIVDHLLSRLEAARQPVSADDTVVNPYLLRRNSVQRL